MARPKGSKNKATIEQREALRQFKNRVRQRVHRLFNAQASHAEGVQYLIRVDDKLDKRGNKIGEKHVRVTDPEEMIEALDNGLTNGEKFYYLTAKDPDNKALDSLLDRTFGKAPQSLALTGKGGGSIELQVTKYSKNKPK